MKLTIQKVSEFLLATLLYLHPFFPGEVFSAIAFSLLVLYLIMFNFKFALPKVSIIYLFSLIALGALTGITTGFHKDYFRDFWLFSKPVYMIYFGALLGLKLNLNTVDKILKIIIIAGLVSALWHFVEIIKVPGWRHMSLADIRDKTRHSSLIEIMTMGIILYSLFRYKNKLFNKKIMVIIFSIIFISTLLFVSRTMFLLLFVYVGLLFDYFRLSFKSVFAAIVVILGLFYIFSLQGESGDTAFGRIVLKIQKSPSELIFSDDETNNKAAVNEDWRGYEALMVLNQTVQGGIVPICIGSGFGSLVDLKITMVLDGQAYRYIPQVHNGYAEIFLKTGTLGLIIYLIFMFSIFRQAYLIKNLPQQFLILKKLILASIVTIFLTTTTIAGIYNIQTLDAILIITFLSLIMLKRYSAWAYKNAQAHPNTPKQIAENGI